MRAEIFHLKFSWQETVYNRMSYIISSGEQLSIKTINTNGNGCKSRNNRRDLY